MSLYYIVILCVFLSYALRQGHGPCRWVESGQRLVNLFYDAAFATKELLRRFDGTGSVWRRRCPVPINNFSLTPCRSGDDNPWALRIYRIARIFEGSDSLVRFVRLQSELGTRVPVIRLQPTIGKNTFILDPRRDLREVVTHLERRKKLWRGRSDLEYATTTTTTTHRSKTPWQEERKRGKREKGERG